jgi:nitroreductase
MRALSPGIIGNPTAIIVICTDKNKIRNIKEGNIDEMIWIDLGAALQNMLLAAHELGYGGCPIGSFHKKALEAFLNIPENFDIRLLVVLGKPKNIPKAPPKRPLEEIFLEGKFSGRENG